jgi:gliding motility-associated lipoprotein GldH
MQFVFKKYCALRFLGGFLLVSCGKTPYFADLEDISDESWSEDNPVSFEFDIEDTLKTYDLFIDVRNNTNYKYSNLYIFVDVTLNGEHKMRDTVELPITEPDGKWTGTASGTLVDNHFLTYPSMVFKKSGKYGIKLTQAMMGEDKLPGIASVGVSLYELE